jgi:ssDNA-binding Zn-finger/Zn-ribbon topoisomerase 1
LAHDNRRGLFYDSNVAIGKVPAVLAQKEARETAQSRNLPESATGKSTRTRSAVFQEAETMKCPDCGSDLEKKLNKRQKPYWKCTNAVCKFWGNASGTGKPNTGTGDPGASPEKKVSKTPQKEPDKKPAGTGDDPPKAKPGIFSAFGF